MPTTEKIAETDEGQADLKGNELLLRDLTGADPVAWRGRSANSHIVKWSADGPDGKGSWVELGYLLAKHDERPGHHDAVEFEFWFKLPGTGSEDKSYEKSFAIRHDGVVHYKGASDGQQSGRFYHEGGRFVTIYQNDGHIVEYDMKDGLPWVPVWSNWRGLLKPLPW